MTFSTFSQPPVADAGGHYVGDEGSIITLDGSGSADVNGVIQSYEWDLDNDILFNDATGVTVQFSWPDDGAFTVGLKVTDNDGESDTDKTTVTVSNVAPSVGKITAPADPVKVGTPINFGSSFDDPGILDTHTALWDWGDGSMDPGTVYETSGSGSVTGQHT